MAWLLLTVIVCAMRQSFATTMEPTSVTCPVCGTVSEQMRIMSTNEFGSQDLDLRPPPMARWTLHSDVECCPNCGLCQAELGETEEIGNTELAVFVHSTSFQTTYKSLKQLVSNEHLPATSSSFHRLALLETHLNASKFNVAWTYLKAAWICDDVLSNLRGDDVDDEDDSEHRAQFDVTKYEAVRQHMLRYRSLAAQLIEEELVEKDANAANSEFHAYRLMRMDMLRRMGRYDECIESANAYPFNPQKEDIMSTIVRFQKYKCEKRDNQTYTVKDAEGYYSIPDIIERADVDDNMHDEF